jgi:hypothetical protein
MNAKERILGKLRASLAGTTPVADDYDIAWSPIPGAMRRTSASRACAACSRRCMARRG